VRKTVLSDAKRVPAVEKIQRKRPDQSSLTPSLTNVREFKRDPGLRIGCDCMINGLTVSHSR